jgi:hypothetical protein
LSSFTHLSSDDRKNRYCEQVENLDKRTVGYRNRTQATRKSTDVMIEMLKQALTYVDSAKYVLFDSWFCFPGILLIYFTARLFQGKAGKITVGNLSS